MPSVPIIFRKQTRVMKKHYLILAALLLAAACKQEILPVETAGPAETRAEGASALLTVTLPGIEGVETRVALSDDGKNGFKLEWKDGDVLTVGGKQLTLSGKVGAAGSFSGEWTAGKAVDIVYGKVGDAPAAQTQKASGTFDHIVYGAELKGVKIGTDGKASFAHDWATAHGGTFRQSGILRLELRFPETLSVVKSVKVSGEGLSETTLTVTDGALVNGAFVAYVQTDAACTFKAGDTMTLTVIDGADEEYVNTFEPGPQTLHEGYVTTLRTSASCWLHALNGKGSENDPYLITNLEELANVRNILTENTITHFRLMNDLDMASVTDWKPYNQQNAGFGISFDGNGKTISNFTCTDAKWASFIGVLHGTVKNLTFVNPVIRTTTNSEVGVVCAWAGNNGGSLSGHLENVHVTGGMVSCSGTTHYFGGICGRACNSSIKDCSFDGTVERTSSQTYDSVKGKYYPVGGLLGQAMNDVTISGCSTSGKLITKSGRSTGGVVGYCSVALDIVSCSSSMEITSTHDVTGGICGYYGNGTVSDCSFTGSITVGVGGGSSYTGGILAHTAGDVTLLRCSNTGEIKAAESIVGGIIGQCNSNQTKGAVMRECRSTGNVSGKATVGGLIGRASNVGDGLVMENCYATGDVSGTSSYVGGLAGDLPKNATMRNSFATGAVKGAFAIGGVAGRAYGRLGSGDSPLTDVNTTVTGCIAWNPSVKTTTAGGETPANHYSGATVIGFTAAFNALSNNWRRPDIDFHFYQDEKLNVPFDQEEVGQGKALVTNYTDPVELKWYYPYHGKAAAAGEKLSAVAQRIGYDASLWDFSGDVPELKIFK